MVVSSVVSLLRPAMAMLVISPTFLVVVVCMAMVNQLSFVIFTRVHFSTPPETCYII